MLRYLMLVLTACCAVPFIALTAPAAAVAAPDKKVMALCEEAKPRLLKDLETLVNMDSGSDNQPGLLQKQELLADKLRKLGGEVRIVPAPKPREGLNNIVATWKGTGKARIMYMAHFDTVWPVGEAAKRPFTIEGDIARGPGISDAQANVAAAFTMLDILLVRLGEKNFDTLTLLYNPDEESGSLGSRDLIMELAERHDVVYSLEGGGRRGRNVTTSARGNASFRLQVKGRESHSGGAPEKGVNAGYEMAYQILQLRDLGNKEARTSVNWVMGKFGTKSNVIPGSAWALANARISKDSEVERVEKDIRERIQNKLLPESEITLTVRRGRPPFEENPATSALAEKVVKLAADELELKLFPRRNGGGTDACYSFPQAPTLEGMGLAGAGAHSLDEYIPLDPIAPRLYLLVRVAQETMKGTLVPLAKR